LPPTYRPAGLPEHWRAWRKYAGALHLAYLDTDLPYSFTCDNFREVENLKLDPHFVDYVGESFKPLGVYVNFWQPTLPAGHQRTYRVMLVKDTHQPAQGKLTLSWQPIDGGGPAQGEEETFSMPPLGQQTCEVILAAPQTPGKYRLVAKAFWDGQPWSPTVSRRNVQIVTTVAPGSGK